MTLKFDHAVIYGGNYYPANSPIEVAEEKPVDQAAPKTEKKAAKDGNKRAGRKPKS